MNRRDFLKTLAIGAVSFSTACTSLNRAIPENEQITITDESGIDEFVKEISKYDILHFGEAHVFRNPKETTTIEDFVDFFLPKFRNEKLVKEPYNYIRTECLPYELGQNGEEYVSQQELDNFDKNGIITPNETPTFYKCVFHPDHKDPNGAIKIAKQGTLLGYRVRGVTLPPDIPTLVLATPMDKEQLRGVIASIRLSAIDENYLHAIRCDMRKPNRLIVYGGAIHNDDNDFFKFGVADEIKKEFRRRYLAIDLIKPAVIAQDDPYLNRYYLILESEGLDPFNLNNIIIFKRKNDQRADYIAFLPERKYIAK